MTDTPPVRDPGQAGQLYETYAGRVFATCLAMLGSREDAADAMHEVFARALPLADTLEHPAAWLQTAARHHCADLVRRRQLAERRGTPMWGSDRAEPDPADVVELRHDVAAAMASLSERERIALSHQVMRDATVPEVASRMRLSYAAAVQLLSRARRRAAEAVQLPSAFGPPALRPVSAVLRRLASLPAQATGAAAASRSAATGAVVLCATTLLCTGGTSRPSAHLGAAPPAAVRQAAPLPPLALPPGPLPIAAGPPLATAWRAPLARVRALLWPGSAPACPPATSIPPSGPSVVWTDPANDEKGLLPKGAGPQNDLVSATLSTSGSTLVVRIHVQRMSLTPPLGSTGMQWWFTFRDGTQPAGYVQADIESGQTSYTDAILDNGAAGQVHEDSGTIVTGPDGYVEVDVPFPHFNLHPGDLLHGIGGEAMVDPAGGIVDTVSVAALGTYRVPGAGC